MTTIIGNVSQAAETRTVKVKGVPTLVTDFNLAENRGFGENQVTKYWRISVWRDRGAKLAKYLTVGRPVYVIGYADTSAYIDKEGKAKSRLEMTNPIDLKLIGKNAAATEKEAAEAPETIEVDEIPEDVTPF